MVPVLRSSVEGLTLVQVRSDFKGCVSVLPFLLNMTIQNKNIQNKKYPEAADQSGFLDVFLFLLLFAFGLRRERSTPTRPIQFLL